MTQGTLQPLIATRIELLIGALGTATKVAECVGVTRPLLSKWRHGSVMPSPAQLKLLVDLDHVMARAADMERINEAVSKRAEEGAH